MATSIKNKNISTKQKRIRRSATTTRRDTVSHKIAFTGAIALVVIAVITVSVVNIDRSRIARSVSEAPAPSAVINLTEVGATVNDLLVKKGQSVIWHAEDGNKHKLALVPTSTSAAGFGENIVIDGLGSYNYIFDTVGTYYYYDILNPELIKGMITVKE